MKNYNSYEYGRREYQRSREDDSFVVLVGMGAALLAGGCYLLVGRFLLRAPQLIEVGLYLASISAAAGTAFWRTRNHRRGIAGRWPQSPVFVPMLRDRKHVAVAAKRAAIVAGYDIQGKPWLWHDHQRRMQSILIGQSGSGKTTLLYNIASQDIRRTVAGRHLPLIIFDGKGDQEFLNDVLYEVCAAGRLDHFRLIDPFRPEISARFNPLFSKGATHQERVNAFFDSFFLRQDFFRAHQATYLSDVCRVLHATGAVFNIPDVLVMARDEVVMKEQIAKARLAIENDRSLPAQRRQNFEMSARNLLQSLEDRERVPKIQGLLNELMSFTEDDLSAITNSYQNLLTLDEVIERDLILFVSLNTNKNSRAVTALGRMLLQNLQLMVGERYLDRERGAGEPPMVSVILDEFAPFAHPNFAQMLQTARGSNVALLFSVQSIPQLRSVSRNFGDEISSAPNTVMLLRTRDEETARFFLNASARITGERKTMTVEKKGFFEEEYKEIGFGSITEIERTRAVDYHIKNLPAGQMQVLTTDSRLGTLHLHLHIRRPRSPRLPIFEPVLYSSPAEPGSVTRGAQLRFRNPDLARRMGRIFSRSKRKW
jgi:type IV secretory system conjugative DNA transfer VirD4/TraG family protein